MPHVLLLGILCLPILCQPDFGSAAIICLLAWVLMFIGGVSLKHLLGSLLLMIPGFVIMLLSKPYRIRRITCFLDPWQYAKNEGYQTIHSLMAFGTGGVWGTGVGLGYQKLFYLPEPHTDFIFSVIGEELGLMGVILVIVCFALILSQGIKIARNARDNFESLLAAGLTAALGIQVCINMCVAVALLPTKGLTLPFLSYGGTSLVVNMASVGILMNIGAPREK
jgi:cell division protein FtsW